MNSFDKWWEIKLQQHAQETGNELGEELGQMSQYLTTKYPYLSKAIGVCCFSLMLIYGLTHWELEIPLLLVISSIAGFFGYALGIFAAGLALSLVVLELVARILF